MIKASFAGSLIPHEKSTEALALALVCAVANGYGLPGQPSTLPADDIDGLVEIRLTSSIAHGLFMPAIPPGEDRRRVYAILAQRLQVAVGNLDDVALANEIDMALVRKYRALVEYVGKELLVIPAPQPALIAA